jgi:O-succinylhomoserine sulfhydrylase
VEAVVTGPDGSVPSVRIPKPLPDGVGQATIGVRGGLLRSGFEETAEALFLNSGYVYSSAGEAEKAFTGEIDRYVYSRYGNPTTSMFEERLRLIEDAPAAFATATGMAAVFTALGALLGAGDRLVAARSLFGSCFVVCSEILPRWGVETVFVDGEDLSQWEEALSVPTQAVFFETPSNPMQSLVDIAAVSDLAHAAGAKVVLDNVFATPLLQQGMPLGADVVVYSGTKHIDGQGRVLGGAILGDKEYIDGPVQKLMRHTGPAISAFNAWTMLKGLETLAVRVDYSNKSAHRIAEFLEGHPSVSWVKYPFLESHPQYDLAKRQMRGGGTVVTFELAGGTKDRAFEVLDKLRVIDISNNLGDSKSLITHPATTTHRAMGPDGRAAIGLGDGVVRISIGLEGTEDLITDLDRALG